MANLLALWGMCPNCEAGRTARDLVVSNEFWPHVLQVLLPFVVVALVIRTASRHVDQGTTKSNDATSRVSRRAPLVVAGLVLGVGLGGFLDGIVLHQILQWHNILSSVVPPTDLIAMKYNMVWDGLFHAVTWLTCALGVGLLFRAGRRQDAFWSGHLLVGALLGGCGLFNFVEGISSHLALGIHHVHPGDGQLAWDVSFVVLAGLGFMLVGYVTSRRGCLDPRLPGRAKPSRRT
jgi:uncharacterized membrane protein